MAKKDNDQFLKAVEKLAEKKGIKGLTDEEVESLAGHIVNYLADGLEKGFDIALISPESLESGSGVNLKVLSLTDLENPKLAPLMTLFEASKENKEKK